MVSCSGSQDITKILNIISVNQSKLENILSDMSIAIGLTWIECLNFQDFLAQNHKVFHIFSERQFNT